MPRFPLSLRALIAALSGALVVCCVRRGDDLPPPSGPIPSAQKPLALSLPRWPGGEMHSLESDRGHVLLLDVWATWCEPCRDALPTYEQLLKEYGARGLRVYAINVDGDQSFIEPFVKETKLTLPILLDPDAAVAERQLKVKMMPTSFLVDRRGFIRHVHEGFSEEFLARYQAEIESLLAEKAD